jgi:predicted metal-binding membrane protein
LRDCDHRSWLIPILGGLVGTAWAALYLWEKSPYGRYLDHGSWTQTGLGASICGSLPAASWFLPVTLYVGGWLLMTAAMMLPTIVPLLDRFDRIVRQRADRAALIALVVGGYLLAWLGFGVAAHLFDAALHRAVLRSQWLLVNGWAVGSLILAIAGLFQFSRLKNRCLSRCRTPFSFIVKHWRGRTPARNAFRLGLDHGAFCVACCWALMLVMFVVGTASIGWMLALGVVMAVEKNAPWGARVRRPLGGALLFGAAVLAGLNLWA